MTTHVFGSLHPRVMATVPLVLDLNKQFTLVELQDQEGRMRKITLTDWYVELGEPVPDVPYFQIKFSHGIEARSLTYGGSTGNSMANSMIPNAIQVPMRGRSAKEVPVVREFMIPRVFSIELFDSEGQPFTPARLVLWFMFDLE